MSYLCLFTAPKPFTDPHIATIQRNAIRSWQQLGAEAEVILVGQEAGMVETATQLAVKQLPDVARNENGTPLVSSIFSLVRQASTAPIMVYLNADILLFPDFINTVRQVVGQAGEFLMIGQRWDLAVTQELDFSSGWAAGLQGITRRKGRLHRPAGSDYFVFPRQLFVEMPDFAIGRAGWDNWMIYHARQQKWPVIDATPSLMVVHQSHDYNHLPGGQPHYNLPESDHNMALAGGAQTMFIVLDSDKQLVGGKIRSPRITMQRFLRRAELFFAPRDGGRRGTRWAIARKFRRLRKRRYETYGPDWD